MNRCLNCGEIISDDAEDYFEYVTDGEKLEDHPEFKTKIEGENDL